MHQNVFAATLTPLGVLAGFKGPLHGGRERNQRGKRWTVWWEGGMGKKGRELRRRGVREVGRKERRE